jgi:hypothetical protein
MSDLPGYDDWKLASPDDSDRCEHCGCSARSGDGFRPDSCTGECGVVWRDPDAENDARRDDPPPEEWER